MERDGKRNANESRNGGRPGDVRRAISGQKRLMGTISILRRGGGFVETKRGRWFVPRGKLNYAMDGDVVELSPLPQRQRSQGGVDATPRAEVVSVIERSCFELVGSYERTGTLGIVLPLDERVSFDLFCDARSTDARTGDLVVARIDRHPTRAVSAQATVVEVLGSQGDALARRAALLRQHGIDRGFPKEAEAEADALALDVDAALAEPLRHDLRGRNVLTIDPVSARDFDDALSLERLEGGRWRMGIHIADVAAYVTQGSALDDVARERACSVYFVGEVIHMLPEQLSCGLCSIMPGADRLAMTIDVELDEGFNPVACEMYPSVIKSQLRLTYDEVQAVLDGQAAAPKFADGVSAKAMLRTMDAIAEKMRAQRLARGALDIETPEPEFEPDSSGRVESVRMHARTDATSLVEEVMILANTLVAQRFSERGEALVYRVHGEPTSSALVSLAAEFAELGWEVDPEQLRNPRSLSQLVEQARELEAGGLIDMLVLRSMKQAAYSADKERHFGLGLDAYCHFTSPIRRYPDLVVHRLLKASLSHQTPPEGLCDDLSWIASHSSEKEREADEAERDSVADALIEYLAGRLGEEFSGIVAGVSRDGTFVRLDLGIEGLIHAQEDARRRDGHEWRLGERVDVRIVEVVPQRRLIVLSPVIGRRPDAPKRKKHK